jgi:putative heme-binding domain-containing protein
MMRRHFSRSVCPLILSVCFSLAAAGQETAKTNPFSGDAKAVEEGKSLFRINCSLCHGIAGRGGIRGPDLSTGRWVHGGSDEDLFNTILRGVPGTPMPANDLTDEETWLVISYLRSLTPQNTAVRGDKAAGERTFWGDGNCSLCHMVNGKGGRVGPDLSRVGSMRPLEYLTESIRQPDAHLSEGLSYPYKDLAQAYEKVVVVTSAGKRITGVALNEDTFTLQMMDQSENLYLLQKKDLRSVEHTHKSLMPAYGPDLLSDQDLQDLLAYLSSLRGAKP